MKRRAYTDILFSPIREVAPVYLTSQPLGSVAECHPSSRYPIILSTRTNGTNFVLDVSQEPHWDPTLARYARYICTDSIFVMCATADDISPSI